MKVCLRSKQQQRQALSYQYQFLRQLRDFSTAKDNLSRSMTNSYSWKWRCAPCACMGSHHEHPRPQCSFPAPTAVSIISPPPIREHVLAHVWECKVGCGETLLGFVCDSTCKLPVLCGWHCHQSGEIWLSNTHFTVLLSWQTTSTHKQTLDSSLEKRQLGKLLKSLQNYSDWPLKTKRTFTGMCSCSKLLLHS